MRKLSTAPKIKLSEQATKDLSNLYLKLKKDEPYIEVSWSALVSELVMIMNEKYFSKEKEFLKAKFFNCKAFIDAAAGDKNFTASKTLEAFNKHTRRMQRYRKRIYKEDQIESK